MSPVALRKRACAWVRATVSDWLRDRGGVTPLGSGTGMPVSVSTTAAEKWRLPAGMAVEEGEDEHEQEQEREGPQGEGPLADGGVGHDAPPGRAR